MVNSKENVEVYLQEDAFTLEDVEKARVEKKGLTTILTTYEAVLMSIIRSGVVWIPMDKGVMNSMLYILKSADLKEPPRGQIFKGLQISNVKKQEIDQAQVDSVINRLQTVDGFTVENSNSSQYLQIPDTRASEVIRTLEYTASMYGKEISARATDVRHFFRPEELQY